MMTPIRPKYVIYIKN